MIRRIEYSPLDDVKGLLTNPEGYVDLDMKAIMKYRRENNIDRKLTKKELEHFTNKPKSTNR